MNKFSRAIVLITLFTLAFSWTGFFEKIEHLKQKGEKTKDQLSLESLGLSKLKDISLKDLAHFETPDLSSKLDQLKDFIPKDLDPAHHKEVEEFWTGAFEGLNLPKPTELIECFGRTSGKIFFRKLQTINNLLQHSKAGQNVKLHTDYVQLEVFMSTLHHAYTCMVQSHDFERLADSLDISHDPEVLKQAKYMYFEAKYDILADEFSGIIEEIDNKNYKEAGKAYAELFRKAVEDYKKVGEDKLAYQAFGNGLSGTLGAPLPKESLDCYSSEHAKILMEFFKGVSNAVTEGKWYKAEQSLAEYWEQEGKDLLSKIPNKVWSCDLKSKDSKEISDKLGLDLGSEEFRQKVWDYVNDHNIMFYSYLRSIKKSMDSGDYLHAGASYAYLLEAVAKAA